jgi:Flp pilus assembly protein TadG
MSSRGKRGWMSRTLRGKKGAAVVEFALVVPILLLLVIGILEFGRVLHTYLVVVNAAREGARYAAVGISKTDVIDKVKKACPAFDPSLLTIEVTGAQGPRGQPVTVKVTYPVDIVTPLFERVFSHNPFPVSAEAVMRLE